MALREGAAVIETKQVNGLKGGDLARVEFSWTAAATAAQAVLTVTADSGNRISEANEGNNEANHTVVVRAPPVDLSVSSADITHAPQTPAAGQTVTVEVVVKNVGTASCPSFKVALIKEETVLKEQTVSSLGAGKSATVSLAWKIPAGLSGEVALTVVVDSQRRVNESNESNNQATHTITVVTPAVDLAISPEGISHVPAAPLPGQTVTVKAAVKNIGTASSKSFKVALLREGAVLKEQTVSSLGAGKSATVSLAWKIPTDVFGDVTLTVVVDSQGQISESDEGNNQATHTLTVATPTVDLAISPQDVTHTPQTPTPGQNVTVTAKVQNLGNSKATAVVVAFYLADQLLGSKKISSIASGSKGQTGLSFKVPVGSEGTLTLTIRVDPEDKIDETNEENNTVTHQVTLE